MRFLTTLLVFAFLCSTHSFHAQAVHQGMLNDATPEWAPNLTVKQLALLLAKTQGAIDKLEESMKTGVRVEQRGNSTVYLFSSVATVGSLALLGLHGVLAPSALRGGIDLIASDLQTLQQTGIPEAKSAMTEERNVMSVVSTQTAKVHEANEAFSTFSRDALLNQEQFFSKVRELQLTNLAGFEGLGRLHDKSQSYSARLKIIDDLQAVVKTDAAFSAALKAMAEKTVRDRIEKGEIKSRRPSDIQRHVERASELVTKRLQNIATVRDQLYDGLSEMKKDTEAFEVAFRAIEMAKKETMAVGKKIIPTYAETDSVLSKMSQNVDGMKVVVARVQKDRANLTHTGYMYAAAFPLALLAARLSEPTSEEIALTEQDMKELQSLIDSKKELIEGLRKEIALRSAK